ncbi:MAG: site-specific integrase [Eubacterium sp.]|nr:site-specific integrase [Eubacterium sp.]
MKINDPLLYKTIKEFLTHYLPTVRRRSPNTILAYQATLNLFLEFIQGKTQKKLSEITIAEFNAKYIEDFMEWLTAERKNVATTVNLRMTNIRKFCEYLQKNKLIPYADYAEMQEISKQPDDRKKGFEYLSVSQTKIVLNIPDTEGRIGLRDKFFISLMYDSGCRDQEMLDLRLKDFLIRDDGKAELQVIGKGSKYRVTPISEEVITLYRKYCKVFHPQSSGESNLFYTIRNGITTSMSADNVARFLNKYEKLSKESDSTIPHLHPHLFRRTRAMHLYTAGVPLPLVSEWLGHSRLETTQIYARASLEMKRNAAKTFESKSEQIFMDNKFKYDDDNLIKKLYGLC